MSTLCASNFQRNISQFEHDFWSKHPDTYPLFIKYQVSASKSKWAMFFFNHQLDPKFAQFPSTWIYLEKSVEIKGITFLQTISWMWCFRTICIDHFPRISPQFFTSFVLPQGNFLVGWPKKNNGNASRSAMVGRFHSQVSVSGLRTMDDVREAGPIAGDPMATEPLINGDFIWFNLGLITTIMIFIISLLT